MPDPITGGLMAGSTLLSAASSKSAGKKQAKAATQAAQVQSQAADRAAQLQQQQYEQSRQDFAPYRDAGSGALNQLSELASQAPEVAPEYSYKDFNYQQDPGYQFRLDEGNKAIDRAAAARGGYDSGSTLKALTKYGQDYATNDYAGAKDRYNTDRNFDYNAFSDIWNRKTQGKNDQFNMLQNIASMGSGATNNLASLGASAANNRGNLMTGAADATAGGMTTAADARASGTVGAANAINSGISQGFDMYQTDRFLKSLNGSQGSQLDYFNMSQIPKRRVVTGQNSISLNPQNRYSRNV